MILVVGVLGLLSVAAVRGLARLRDHWAVAAAEAAAGELVREARMRAVARGGARVIVDAVRDLATLEAGTVELRRVSFSADYGVDVDLGRLDVATIVLDPAGLGRLAGRSIDLTRGHARRRVVISGYGRVR